MAAGDDLKLIGVWASPFVVRVKLALSFKGLSYENVEVDLTSKSELLLSSNPVHKKVPVLLHKEKPICESMVIVQYIDEAFAGTSPSLLSSEPHERAVARFWAAYIDDKLVASCIQSFRGKTEEDKSEGTKQMFTALENLEGALKESCNGEGYFGGESVGFVDVSLGGLLSWLNAAEVMSGTGIKIFDPIKTPLLAAWTERFRELDGAKEALPDNDMMVEFARKRQAQAAAVVAASEN
ncbi:probable glutathione S-transferase GSTU6 [Lolium perenne]|uniref:probable glutathione S-transferase GSTU6 n=1 Tax=Lolium perenne TaxID=4522 RepID=UPI0021F5D00C|nr:probable glutathione S-transferase GSTU6 [Lolium perenne]